MKALHIAASGMAAQERNVEVISNNIANLRTTGFKRQRVEFQDMLYQNLRRMGTSTSEDGTLVPTGVQIGSGVKLAATTRLHSQGNAALTEKPYDLAVQGEGHFQVQLPDGTTGYTRDGSFEIDPTGQLVTVDGYRVQPNITIPDDAKSVSVSRQGLVEAIVGDEPAPQNLGQLTLAVFTNTAGLEAIGDNFYLQTEASGQPQIGNPGNLGFGTLLQGYLEQSNVNAVSEIADIIAAQRAYEMNSRIISAADEMMSATSNLR
ncbi:MAG: flagellar basal-body rod protein FlgG [Pseudomonadota bacterium]